MKTTFMFKLGRIIGGVLLATCAAVVIVGVGIVAGVAISIYA